MAAIRRAPGPPLGELLSALRSRLDALPPENVAALVAHAERLPAARPSLTSSPSLTDTRLHPVRHRTRHCWPRRSWRTSRHSPPEQPPGSSAEDDDWDCRYDRHNRWDDEEEDGLSWVEEADALFAAAGEAFVDGQLDLARQAYGRLLDAFGNAPGDSPLLETRQLETTDVDEALARHLRAVYETTPPAGRAAAVHSALLSLPWCPSPPRLHDVSTTRQDGPPDLPAFLPDWIDRLLAETTRPSPQHRTRLLAGHLNRAVVALAGSNPQGWSSPTHPDLVVLPCLWVAATAAEPPPADESPRGQAFAAIDRDVQSLHDWQLDVLNEDDRTGHSDAGDPSATSMPLTGFLTRAILGRSGGPTERRRWLAAAATTVEERVDAIVGNKHRKAYARVASLAVAHAEALAVVGIASDGQAYLTGIREKYPRRTAFHSELDAAVSASTLTSRHRPSSSAATRNPRRPGRQSS